MTTKNKDTNSSMQLEEDKLDAQDLLSPWVAYGMTEEEYWERIAEGSASDDLISSAFEALLNA